MSSWFYAIAALFVCVAAVVAHVAIQSLLNKRHLRKVFHDRVPEAAFDSCKATFPQVEQHRIALAYSWVQALVPFAEPAPIEATDDLWKQLRIDQGSIDDQFESAHEWRGERPEASARLHTSPLCTVRDLMAEVLAQGYEGYAAVPSRGARRNAA